MKTKLFSTDHGSYVAITDGGDIASGSTAVEAVEAAIDIAKHPVETVSVYDLDPRFISGFYTKDGELFCISREETTSGETVGRVCIASDIDKACFTGK